MENCTRDYVSSNKDYLVLFIRNRVQKGIARTIGKKFKKA